VVLLDVNMPGMSGLDVLERLNRLKPRPAVIMLTVDTGEGTGIRALSLGAYGYLTKPFEAARVLAAVESALSDFLKRTRDGD
jgi:DNA-binding response OmpR family regulator